MITAIVRLADPAQVPLPLGACERAGGVEFQLRLSEFVARLQAPIGRGERWEVRLGEYRCEKISMRVGYAA